jgi:hypothetical protein
MAKRKPPVSKPTTLKAGRGRGNDGSPYAVALRAGNPDDADGSDIVRRRHQDWAEHEITWRFFLDSFEGGNRYRNAVYGVDRLGMPVRNLLRHKREYPDGTTTSTVSLTGIVGAGSMINDGSGALGLDMGPFPGSLGADPGATAMDDDYEMRRARTPIPEFVSEAIGVHLSKLYDQEVDREAPPDVTAWWLDVDGKGTSIDDYMRETVAPLLMAIGQLDLLFDHPKAPPGQVAVTRADEIAMGLDACVVSYILPQNVVWWSLDRTDRYAEVLVREYENASNRLDRDRNGAPIDPDGSSISSTNWRRNYVRFRHWTATQSTLYSCDGSTVIETIPHSYGRVPIVRLIDVKKHRTSAVGKSRYEIVCELQRAHYNQLSELILSSVIQGHPFLQGPESYLTNTQTIAVGPNYVLPMKADEQHEHFSGWSYVAPTVDPTAAMRLNLDDLEKRIDRAACLTQPVGVAHLGAGAVAQSGVSKRVDAQTGHKVLTAIAKSLGKAELTIAEYAMLVLRSKPVTPADRESIDVGYPAHFDLNDAETLIDTTIKLQLVMSQCGNAPETEQALITSTVRQLLVGMDDSDYEAMDDEIELLVAAKATIKEQMRELDAGEVTTQSDPMGGTGGGLDEDDRTGQAGGTALGGMVPAAV